MSKLYACLQHATAHNKECRGLVVDVAAKLVGQIVRVLGSECTHLRPQQLATRLLHHSPCITVQCVCSRTHDKSM